MKHGTSSAYVIHGCRCKDCKEWNRLRSARQRATKSVYLPGRGQSNYTDEDAIDDLLRVLALGY